MEALPLAITVLSFIITIGILQVTTGIISKSTSIMVIEIITVVVTSYCYYFLS